MIKGHKCFVTELLEPSTSANVKVYNCAWLESLPFWVGMTARVPESQIPKIMDRRQFKPG